MINSLYRAMGNRLVNYEPGFGGAHNLQQVNGSGIYTNDDMLPTSISPDYGAHTERHVLSSSQ